MFFGAGRKYGVGHERNSLITIVKHEIFARPRGQVVQGAALCLLTRWTRLHRISSSRVFLVLSLLCVHIFVLNYVPCGGAEDKS